MSIMRILDRKFDLYYYFLEKIIIKTYNIGWLGGIIGKKNARFP